MNYQVKCFSQEYALLIILVELPLWCQDAQPIFFGGVPKGRTLTSYDTACDSDKFIVNRGWKIRRERRTNLKCGQKNNAACGSRTKPCLILASPQFLLFLPAVADFSSCYIMPLRQSSSGLLCSMLINWNRNLQHFFALFSFVLFHIKRVEWHFLMW